MTTASATSPSPVLDRPERRPHEPIDTAVTLVTPERVAFRYPVAGPFRRLPAYLIDALLIVGILLVAGFVAQAITGFAQAGAGLFLVILFVLVWGYGAFFESVFNGRTPGKKLLRLRVVSADGTPIVASQAVVRNLAWTVEGLLPFAGLPALVSTVLTRRFQRLGDLAAGTMVVVEQPPPRSVLVRIDPKPIRPLLDLLPRRIDAGPELARALADYSRRRGRFGPARREEMARPLARAARERYGLPASASADEVVAALYYRVFLED